MGWLDGGAQALFGEIMTPLYLAAKLSRGGDLTYGPDGSIEAGSAEQNCLAKVDSATTRMREAPGYTDTDRAITILATSVATPPTTDNIVEILAGDYVGEKYGIASIDRPPGCSYYLCRGVRRGEG